MAVVRRDDVKLESAVQTMNIGDLAADTDWSAALMVPAQLCMPQTASTSCWTRQQIY